MWHGNSGRWLLFAAAAAALGTGVASALLYPGANAIRLLIAGSGVTLALVLTAAGLLVRSRRIPRSVLRTIRRRDHVPGPPRPAGKPATDQVPAGLRDLLVRAEVEARQFDHEHLGAEHLLLAILADESSPSFTALGALGIDPGLVRSKLREDSAPGPTPPTGAIPYTPAAKAALAKAVPECLRLGDPPPRPHHVLLAILGDPHHLAARSLTEVSGLPPPVLHDALAAELRRAAG
ncbi:MAG: hypothetical protein LC722_00225 [Actinobacteria bacterium]|nr:hypothetical protein [Actinomycetota bacterium]